MKFLSLCLNMFALSSLASCGNDGKDTYIKNPEQHIVRELQHKRIVMMGDWKHENASPYHSVTAVLNQWCSMAQNDSSVNRNLGLILERFDEEADHLNAFIRSGDWSMLYDWEFPSMSMERFEFYSNLRHFSQRLDSLNRFLPAGRQLTFDISGAEGRDFSRDEDFQKKTVTERDHWFVYERDSLIAGRVLQYLAHHPTTKILMFYGSAHLIKGRVNKKAITYEPEKDAWGYYAAHYLKQRFGEDSVLSVSQVEVWPDFYSGTPFVAAKGENLFVYSAEIPWEHLNAQDYDAFILRNEATVSHHPFNLIFSRRVVEKSIEHLKFSVPYLPGFSAKQEAFTALGTLEFIASRRFRQPVKEWSHWADTCTTSIPSLLESEDFAASLREDYYLHFKNIATRFRLYQLGFGPGIMREDTICSREFWNQQIWPDILPKLRFVNSIGINWIGYPDEKKKAKEYLVKFTGKDFKEPEEYLRWWRKEFGKATY